jgi:hypothetical protein
MAFCELGAIPVVSEIIECNNPNPLPKLVIVDVGHDTAVCLIQIPLDEQFPYFEGGA